MPVVADRAGVVVTHVAIPEPVLVVAVSEAFAVTEVSLASSVRLTCEELAVVVAWLIQ